MDTFHSELFWQALPVVRVTSVPTSRPLQPFVDISRFERQTSAHRPRIHRAPAAGKAALRHSPKRSKACHFAFWSWKVENHSSANTDVHSCKINKFKIKVYDKFDKWQKGCKPKKTILESSSSTMVSWYLYNYFGCNRGKDPIQLAIEAAWKVSRLGTQNNHNNYTVNE